MSANGIAHLSTKEARQKAKLELAASDRADFGNPRAEYDLTQLPTQYYGNTVEDNINIGGLIPGRPWVTGTGHVYATGLWQDTYNGYFNDDPNFFILNMPSQFGMPTTNLAIGAPGNNKSYQILGYFVPRTTDDYTFYTNSDDASYLWIGPDAIDGFTTSNALVNNGGGHALEEQSGTIALEVGQYYPIRIQYGNSGGSGALIISWSNSSTGQTTDFTDMIFYKTIINGI